MCVSAMQLRIFTEVVEGIVRSLLTSRAAKIRLGKSPRKILLGHCPTKIGHGDSFGQTWAMAMNRPSG